MLLQMFYIVFAVTPVKFKLWKIYLDIQYPTKPQPIIHTKLHTLNSEASDEKQQENWLARNCVNIYTNILLFSEIGLCFVSLLFTEVEADWFSF